MQSGEISSPTNHERAGLTTDNATRCSVQLTVACGTSIAQVRRPFVLIPGNRLMVAKAAWLTIEPEISLAGYLASEEPRYFSSAPLDTKPHNWDSVLDDLEVGSIGDDPLES